MSVPTEPAVPLNSQGSLGPSCVFPVSKPFMNVPKVDQVVVEVVLPALALHRHDLLRTIPGRGLESCGPPTTHKAIHLDLDRGERAKRSGHGLDGSRFRSNGRP